MFSRARRRSSSTSLRNGWLFVTIGPFLLLRARSETHNRPRRHAVSEGRPGSVRESGPGVAERWQSGRMHSLGKRAEVISLSGVRISPSPTPPAFIAPELRRDARARNRSSRALAPRASHRPETTSRPSWLRQASRGCRSSRRSRNRASRRCCHRRCGSSASGGSVLTTISGGFRAGHGTRFEAFADVARRASASRPQTNA